MSNERPEQLDDDPEFDFERLPLNRKVEYLFASQTEVLRRYEEQLKGQQDAMADLLVELNVSVEKVDILDKTVRENTDATNKLHRMVGNYALEVKNSFVRFEERVGAIERREMDPAAVGKLIADIEGLSRSISEERAARERQASIHEEEITSTQNKVVEASNAARSAEEKASKALTLMGKVKSQITPQNATKAGLTAVAFAILEAVLKNWDSIKGWTYPWH